MWNLHFFSQYVLIFRLNCNIWPKNNLRVVYEKKPAQNKMKYFVWVFYANYDTRSHSDSTEFQNRESVEG